MPITCIQEFNKMKYPYQGRDLFSDPESYFYADCEATEFFDAWKTSRMDKMKRLDIKKYPIPENHPDFSSPIEYSKTGQMFADLCKLKDTGLLAEKIETYVVKYEVNKRLYSEYHADNRPVAGAGLAIVPDYLAFGECLARICLELESLKHLSTLLKLCDALCSIPVTYPLSLRLLAILKIEQSLVENA